MSRREGLHSQMGVAAPRKMQQEEDTTLSNAQAEEEQQGWNSGHGSTVAVTGLGQVLVSIWGGVGHWANRKGRMELCTYLWPSLNRAPVCMHTYTCRHPHMCTDAAEQRTGLRASRHGASPEDLLSRTGGQPCPLFCSFWSNSRRRGYQSHLPEFPGVLGSWRGCVLWGLHPPPSHPH